MKLLSKLFIAIFVAICSATTVSAQDVSMLTDDIDTQAPAFDIDSLLATYPTRSFEPIPAYMFRPAVFDTYRMLDTLPLDPKANGLTDPAFNWINDNEFNTYIISRARQQYMINNPQEVRYNESLLPEPPKKFRAVVDPAIAKIVITEVPVSEQTLVAEVNTDFKRRNWLHDFNSLLQFSQAFVSPNWYQGGNNNINILLGLNLDIKLNPAFYPNLLFENSFSYKLSLNGAPEDEVRTYSISEDLLQFTSKFGYKAARHWYYSVNALLKTQILNNYKINTKDELTAAFFSPGELNVGLGMTYSYNSPGGKFSFNVAISPLSYNLKTCFSNRLDVEKFGIKLGRHTANEIGSSLEAKMTWQMRSNIKWTSRLFAFTDYGYVQGDWENTISMSVSKFLSTQLYFHLRYDSQKGAEILEGRWRDWQLKEILSFGLSYTFSSYK